MVNWYAKIIAKRNFIIEHASQEEITFDVNKFWEQTSSQVTGLAKRSKFFISETIKVRTLFTYYNAEFVNYNTLVKVILPLILN